MAARVLRGVARAAAVAFLALALVLVVDRLLAPSDLLMALLASCSAGASAGFAVWILWPLGRSPSDRRVARYVEEHCPELQDRLATALDVPESPTPFADRLLDDAARRSRGIDLDRVVAVRAVRRAVAGGVAATAALATLLLVGADAVGRIARGAWLYAAPFGATLVVEPGEARVAAGESLEVRARLVDTLGALGRSVPQVTVVDRDGGRSTLAMQRRGLGYAATLPPAAGSFTYRVAAAALESDAYAVTVLRAPRVERIDVAYAYPAHTGLESRVEIGGGDVFAPEGTVATLTVHADKPIDDAALQLAVGGMIPLRHLPRGALSASFEVAGDDTYRVVLWDADGLPNRSEDEYVIRSAADDAPFVEVRRPGGDREITPLEEVVIEARAEDDFALDQFDLVYAVAGRDERIVDLLGGERMARIAGVHTLYAEDFDVAPGDVISYYVRAGDANPARTQAIRSDIYFLEVRPFEREFEDAPSQSSLSMDAGTVGQLAAVQKEIIAATWKLDGRLDLAVDDADLVSVADAQAELRQTALGQASRSLQAGASREERQALATAIDAMARAEEALRTAATGTALPSEMEALAALLRAQAAIRRTRISRGGSGQSAAWQPREDLSALFDRDLRREQETNYENRAAASAEDSGASSDALRRVRELAERQAALGRAQEDLARRQETLESEERERVLARLTREQEELRQRAEALERDLERRGGGGDSRGRAESRSSSPADEPSGASAGAAAKRRGVGGVGEPMRRALAELQRGDVAEAAERAREALERLGELAQGLAAGGEAGDEDAARLASELRAADAVRRTLESLDARLGRMGTEPQSNDDTSPGGSRQPPGTEGTGDESGSVEDAARELLRRLEALPDLRDALGETHPDALEDLARWASSRPTGGGRALQAVAQDFATWESLRDGILLAIEAFEANRVRALQAARTGERLDVGGDELVPDGYRPLVERYYRALADQSPRRTPERP
jgi:hypothetical protein